MPSFQSRDGCSTQSARHAIREHARDHVPTTIARGTSAAGMPAPDDARKPRRWARSWPASARLRPTQRIALMALGLLLGGLAVGAAELALRLAGVG
jgi:hypothetical protein